MESFRNKKFQKKEPERKIPFGSLIQIRQNPI